MYKKVIFIAVFVFVLGNNGGINKGKKMKITKNFLMYSYIAIAAVLVCCLVYEGCVHAGIGGGVLCGVIGASMFSLVLCAK